MKTEKNLKNNTINCKFGQVHCQDNFTNINKPEKEQVRKKDWICLVCGNHNFSFRKICNRCQCQTRRNNQYQTNILRKRLDIQINFSLEASYNNFPRALFVTLRQDNSKTDSKSKLKTCLKTPSLTFIQDAQSNENEYSSWVQTVLDEQFIEHDSSDKENITYYGIEKNKEENKTGRPLGALNKAVIY